MTNTIEEAKYSLELGINKFHLKDYDAAIKYVVEAYNFFNEAKDIDNSVVCLCELALVYYYNCNSGFTKSNTLLNEAKELTDNNDCDNKVRAKIFIYIGIINYNEKKYSDALKSYKYAEKILYLDDNCMEYAKLLDNMAVFYLRSNNFQIAIKYLLKSHEIKEKLGNKRELAITKLQIGRHFSNIESYGEAIWYLMQVVEIFYEYNDESNASRIQDELARIYINLGIYEHSKQFCDKSLEVALKLNEPKLRAFSRCTLAHLEVINGSPEKAIDIIVNQVQPVFEELLSGRGYAYTTRILALAHYQLGNAKEAIRLMNEAIKLFRNLEIYGDMARCLLELANIYKDNEEKFLSISSYKLSLKIAHFNNLPLLTKKLEDILFEVDEEEWADIINDNSKKDKAFRDLILADSLDLENNTCNNEKKLKTSLYSLLKIGRAIVAETDVEKLLAIIASETKKALRADRCTVFLYDKERKELYSKIALGMGTKEIRIPSNIGLAGHVFNTGETINIKDTYNDFRFNKDIDRKTGYKTKTILSIPMRNQAHEIIGVFQVLNKLDSNIFTDEDEDLLISISSSAGIALENVRLSHKQQVMYYEQKQSFTSFINTLAASIDARDKITSGHSKRVTSYALAIAEQMELAKEDIEVLEYAAILHDIGKIGIQDSVLCKKGKLTNEEYNHIKEHAYITNEILSTMFFEEKFRAVPEIAASHHEKYDGVGYFKGLKGKEIPIGGRIIAISDVFDAITSKRHYRNCMPILEVFETIKSSSWSHFDGDIVEKFFMIKIDRIIAILLTRDNSKRLPEADKKLFRKYTLNDLYLMLLKPENEQSEEEQNIIALFQSYYNNLVCEDDDE